MAIINAHASCAHCGEEITRRRYAAPYSPDPEQRNYGVDIWVTGDGQYPGDQKFCESHILDDGYSWGCHEPDAT